MQNGPSRAEDRVGSQLDQLFRGLPNSIRITGTPAKFDLDIVAVHPSDLRERTPERHDPCLCGWIPLRWAYQHTD
jgi:hypothetical protein